MNQTFLILERIWWMRLYEYTHTHTCIHTHTEHNHFGIIYLKTNKELLSGQALSLGVSLIQGPDVYSTEMV